MNLSLGFLLGFAICNLCFASPNHLLDEVTPHKDNKVNNQIFLDLYNQFNSGLTYEKAEEIMGKVSRIYPRARYEILWNDRLQANAYNYLGILIWTTKAFIELPMMTEDSFALTMLHEVGHSLGGSPTYPSGASCEDVADAWSATEGLIKLWGEPKTKAERKIFRNRAERAIQIKSSYLEYFENESDNILRILKLNSDLNSEGSDSSCGHQSSEHRKQNMIRALRERVKI